MTRTGSILQSSVNKHVRQAADEYKAIMQSNLIIHPARLVISSQN